MVVKCAVTQRVDGSISLLSLIFMQNSQGFKSTKHALIECWIPMALTGVALRKSIVPKSKYHLEFVWTHRKGTGSRSLCWSGFRKSLALGSSLCPCLCSSLGNYMAGLSFPSYAIENLTTSSSRVLLLSY